MSDSPGIVKMTEIFADCRKLQIKTPGRVTADLIGLGFTVVNDLI